MKYATGRPRPTHPVCELYIRTISIQNSKRWRLSVGSSRSCKIGVFLNCVILKIKAQRLYKWTSCKQHRCENLKYRWTYHLFHTQHQLYIRLTVLVITNNTHAKVKIKQSLYIPGQAMRFPGGSGPQISWQIEREGGKVVSPTNRPTLPPQKIFLVLSRVRGWVNLRAIVRTEWLYQWKCPMTPSGIETAQCLNQMRHRVPQLFIGVFRDLGKKAEETDCNVYTVHTF
jgi:hypothetical protein